MLVSNFLDFFFYGYILVVVMRTFYLFCNHPRLCFYSRLSDAFMLWCALLILFWVSSLKVVCDGLRDW